MCYDLLIFDGNGEQLDDIWSYRNSCTCTRQNVLSLLNQRMKKIQLKEFKDLNLYCYN